MSKISILNIKKGVKMCFERQEPISIISISKTLEKFMNNYVNSTFITIIVNIISNNIPINYKTNVR